MPLRSSPPPCLMNLQHGGRSSSWDTPLQHLPRYCKLPQSTLHFSSHFLLFPSPIPSPLLPALVRPRSGGGKKSTGRKRSGEGLKSVLGPMFSRKTLNTDLVSTVVYVELLYHFKIRTFSVLLGLLVLEDVVSSLNSKRCIVAKLTRNKSYAFPTYNIYL